MESTSVRPLLSRSSASPPVASRSSHKRCSLRMASSCELARISQLSATHSTRGAPAARQRGTCRTRRRACMPRAGRQPAAASQTVGRRPRRPWLPLWRACFQAKPRPARKPALRSATALLRLARAPPWTGESAEAHGSRCALRQHKHAHATRSRPKAPEVSRAPSARRHGGGWRAQTDEAARPDQTSDEVGRETTSCGYALGATPGQLQQHDNTKRASIAWPR